MGEFPTVAEIQPEAIEFEDPGYASYGVCSECGVKVGRPFQERHRAWHQRVGA